MKSGLSQISARSMCAVLSLASAVPPRTSVETRLSRLQNAVEDLARPRGLLAISSLGVLLVAVIECIPRVRCVTLRVNNTCIADC